MKKLKDFLDENGIKYNKFAAKIGVTPQLMSQILLGRSDIPKNTWRKIIQATGNKVTMKDLVDYFLIDEEDKEK